MSDKGDFGDLYAVWRNHPFPRGSGDDSLDELHADLVLADAWVADTVIPFVERGLYRPAQVDVIGELRKLRDRAVELRRVGGEGAQLSDSYRDYADLLLRVYGGFLTHAREDP